MQKQNSAGLAWSILSVSWNTVYSFDEWRFSSSYQEKFPCVVSQIPPPSVLPTPPVFLACLFLSFSGLPAFPYTGPSLSILDDSHPLLVCHHLHFSSAFTVKPLLLCLACEILVPQAEAELRALAVKVLSPNPWTAREFPSHSFSINFNFSLVFYSCCS